MYGWLIVNAFLKTQKFKEIIQMFTDAAKRQNTNLFVFDNSKIYAGVFEHNPEMRRPDYVIFWDKDITLAKYLEHIGIRVFNKASAIETCDNKIDSFIELKKHNVPIPETIPAPMTYDNIGYDDFSFLDEFEKILGYPMIVKEAYGSFGQQVYMAIDRNELEFLAHQCERKPFLFQKYIGDKPGVDLRLQVVGDEVVCGIKRKANNDFRANITRGAYMYKIQPDAKAEELAISAAKATGCDFAGVDLLFNGDDYLVCEVNSNAHFKNLYDCTQINVADKIIQYIKTNI